MLVYNFNLETEKMIKATQIGKFVVHEKWLTLCYMFLFEIKIKKYMLSLDKTDILYEECNQITVLEDNREDIDRFYCLTDESRKSFCEKISKQENDEDIDF
jgi:hypothetical protein